jgi:ABC-2 type transport system permease protein
MTGWRTLLPNAWYIAIREYRGRVRSRSFIIGTFLLAVLAFAATQAPILIDAVAGGQTKVEVVVRAASLPSDAQMVLDQALNGTPASGSSQHKSFDFTWLTSDQLSAAQKDLEGGKFAALLIVDRDASSGDLVFTLHTDLPADGRPAQLIGNAVTSLVIEDRLVRAGTSTAAILAPTRWEVLPVNSSTAAPVNSLDQEISSALLSTGLVVLIFMAIITYGTWVAMSVAEEKGSRVMELMLNATTPLQMLAGKVTGNGAAGLTQYGVIIGAVLAGLVVQGPLHRAALGGPDSGAAISGLTVPLLASFMVLFVLGFLLYSLLYAALGSLVSRQEDVQSATSPLMMIVMVGYFLSIAAVQGITETWVVVLSFVPFFSPYLMLARVAGGHVALWEFGLAVVLMLVSIAVALFVAARIYSAGVLLYGQRVGLRQLFKMARVSR